MDKNKNREVTLFDQDKSVNIPGWIAPPALEVKGVNLFRLLLTSTIGEGSLDFAIEGDTLFIHRLVNNNKRIKYVGKSLIQEAERLARARGLKQLKVNAIDNSHGFYLKMGFESEDDKKGYPHYGVLPEMIQENLHKETLEPKEYLELARRLLADHHQISLKQVDNDFVQRHFWWDLQAQPKDMTPRIKHLIEKLAHQTHVLGEVTMTKLL